jgi:hypothetical protein
MVEVYDARLKSNSGEAAEGDLRERGAGCAVSRDVR